MKNLKRFQRVIVIIGFLSSIANVVIDKNPYWFILTFFLGIMISIDIQEMITERKQ